MRTQPQEIIAQIEQNSGRLEKERILTEALNAELTEFFDGLRLGLDSTHTFGVKKVPTKTQEAGQGLPWSAFLTLQAQLASRELTGHAARDAIKLAMDVATKEQWNGWYRRILIKDMRAGFGESTVNRVCKAAKKPEWGVPVFECQLAHDSAKHEKKLIGKKLIETKLDGVRVLTIVRTNGQVDMFSRNGKEFNNFQHIADQISAVVKEAPPPYDLVLDGEIMSDSFQDLMTQVHRKSNIKANDAVLHLFDIIPYADFLKKFWDKPQKIRSQMVQTWVNTHKEKLANVDCLGYEEVDLDTVQGQLRYIEINKAAIAGNYEGIMVKDPDAPYKSKRSTAWLKLKPFIEVSLTVVAVEEGTGRNEGRLGALLCKGTDDEKFIIVHVGSGFTDDQREEFWNDRDDLIGMIIEIRADAITQNRDDEHYSLRFPRFKSFRGFKTGEKL